MLPQGRDRVIPSLASVDRDGQDAGDAGRRGAVEDSIEIIGEALIVEMAMGVGEHMYRWRSCRRRPYLINAPAAETAGGTLLQPCADGHVFEKSSQDRFAAF